MEVNNASIQLTSSISPSGALQPSKTNNDNEFSAIFASYQSANSVSETKQTAPTETLYPMNTSKGDKDIDLDEYLTVGPQPEAVKLGDIPLLLPTANNIDTLAKYSQEKLQALISEYDIPATPNTIQFDTEGQLVLPHDYPYATELKQALSENPIVENALKTTAALASHYAGIMEGQPFRDEMATARTQADRDRIIDKYAYLFDQNRESPQIVLSFLENGEMLVGQEKRV